MNEENNVEETSEVMDTESSVIKEYLQKRVLTSILLSVKLYLNCIMDH